MSPEDEVNSLSPEECKVLVVDDIPKNIQVLGTMLRSEGYQVIPATSGEQALRAAETHQPDLILLDVMMPEMSGHEVIGKLREIEGVSQTPVIFVTALTDNEDEEKGLSLGAVDYITKPINIPITKSRVRTHLMLRLARKRLEEQNEALREAARLREDVERMSRHDLKTPLTSIIGAPDVIAMIGDLSPQQTELLGRIKASGYRMLDMINRSLDLYKMETGVYQFTPETVDLLKVLSCIADETKNLADLRQASVRVLVNGEDAGEDKSFEISGEELLCYSMLANLIKNALEASPVGETVTVHLDSNGDNIIRVHNQGAVPEEIRETFFEKYTTSGKKQGTGLGTYSAKLIAETQGGSIHLDSNADEGTTVTIRMK